MIAKFDGTCQRCGGPLTRGQKIGWSEEAGEMHVACFDKEMEEANSGSTRQPWMFTADDPVFRIARANLGRGAAGEGADWWGR